MMEVLLIWEGTLKVTMGSFGTNLVLLSHHLDLPSSFYLDEEKELTSINYVNAYHMNLECVFVLETIVRRWTADGQTYDEKIMVDYSG